MATQLGVVLEERGIGVRELSRRCGLSSDTISELARRPRPVYLGTARQIAAALDLGVDEVFPASEQEQEGERELATVR